MKNDMILYGSSINNNRRINLLKKMGINVIYMCDRDKKLWDADKKIYSPDTIYNNPDADILVQTWHYREVLKLFKEKGFPNRVLVWPTMGEWLFDYVYDSVGSFNELIFKKSCNWIKNNEKKLFDIYETKDSYTYKALNQIIYERKIADTPNLLSIDEYLDFEYYNNYFYDKHLAPQGNVVFIDGGAFTGDSAALFIRDYKERVAKIFAFEPDKINFHKLLNYSKKLSKENLLECYNCGLSNESKNLSFISKEIKSCVTENGDTTISLVALDNFLVGKKINGTLCIKLDIEGEECAAISGFKETLQKYKPYLAICVYHKMEDIFAVPQLIKTIEPRYKFYLRAGSHLECYAVPML